MFWTLVSYHVERSVLTKKVSKIMIQESDEKVIREHLLGNLTEEELSRAEERLLADDDYFELLNVMEEELIDDYISGDLTDEDRKQFEAHFLSTPARRDKLRFAQTLKEYVSRPTPVEEPDDDEDDDDGDDVIAPTKLHSPWWKQSLSSPYFGLAAAAVIVIGVGVVIWLIISPDAGASKGMAALKEAYRDQRPVESRITEFGYAPAPPVTRGGEQEKFDYVARDRAQALIQLEAAEHPGAQSHHDLGRLYLTQRDFEKAIDQFDKALKMGGKVAQLESDYGAALMEMGKANRLKDEGGRSFEEFARALEHLTKAINLDGRLLEARFNRALVYQYLMLPNDAEADWRSYLDQDPGSRWADEARRNLKQIEDQKQQKSQNQEQLFEDFLSAYQFKDDQKAWEAFSRSRLRNRNYIVDGLIGSYLDVDLQSRADEAANTLRVLAYAGELEANKTGDRYTSDLAKFYLSITPDQQKTIAQAHLLKRQAKEYANQSRYEKAIEAYGQARRLFEQSGGDCEAKYAEYTMGVCYLRKPDVMKGISIFEGMARSCEAAGYKWLLSKIFYSLADAHDSLMQYSLAIENCNQSLAAAKQLDDRNGQVLGYIQKAIFHETLCDYKSSLNCLYRSLNVAGAQMFDPVQTWIVYDVAAKCFTSVGCYVAALGYQQEALRIAVEMELPLNLSRCYSHLGTIYGKLENYDEAIKVTQKAFDVGKGLPDETAGRDMMASACLRLGNLYKEVGDYEKAISYYDQNLEIYKDLNVQAVMYESHKGKLFCYLAQGDDTSAERELQTALGLIEQYRSKIIEESNRNRFFDSEQDIYDLAVSFSYSKKKDVQSAFDYSEASHARSLLDLSDATPQVSIQNEVPDMRLPYVARPMKLAEIQKSMPQQAQLLNYAVLNDKLIIWVVSKNYVATAIEEVGLDELNDKVAVYRQAIVRPLDDQEQILQLSKQLYDWLIKPIESNLDKKKYIYIVPDKILNYLSFNSLFSSDSKKYLIQDYRVSTCPSATLFIKCTGMAQAKSSSRAESVLSVGNPRFDNTDFPGLQDLPSSAKEAEAVAKLYKNPLAIIGDNAKKTRVKAEMKKVEIIHLALHYVSDENSPMLSKLLLAKEEPALAESSKAQSWLQAYEIYEMKLPFARLAILSACQTGIEHSYRGEGAIGVARPFIKAGVPLVIASLWPVESEATSGLMIRFHEYRKRSNNTTADALRLAQIETLNSSDKRLHHPYYWAPFTLIGGYASF